MRTVFTVEGMTCATCEVLIERKLKKVERRVAKATDTAPLLEAVERLVDNMGKSTKFPLGIIDDFTVYESGRAKTRKIHLGLAERREAESFVK